MKKYIFVHGLAGWGSYDEKYAKKPYWGMRNGDLIQYLRDQGFDCYAASVSPHGSAWDRACELYAQLYGTRVDYGKRHSEEYGHERFGKDFSDCPLCTIEDETELILIGHSFGGTTIRLFSEILVNGSKEEWDASEDDGCNWAELNPSIRKVVIPATKKLPHIEDPERTEQEIEQYLTENPIVEDYFAE